MAALDFERQRERMVREQLRARGIRDKRVLAAMSELPRHEFVPENVRHLAYQDGPLLIGNNQTISQPYMVAYMTECLHLNGKETVLEVGTGSGYQTAVLCRLAHHVISIERYPELARQAAENLARLGVHNLTIHVGDGSQGLPDMAPYDGILVTAAAPAIPRPLLSQLADGGRLVLPVAEDEAGSSQILMRVQRRGEGWSTERLIPVMFVPLVGRYGFKPEAHDAE